jgi:hypothetical protein
MATGPVTPGGLGAKCGKLRPVASRSAAISNSQICQTAKSLKWKRRFQFASATIAGTSSKSSPYATDDYVGRIYSARS